jgi:hypothetical protein
MDKFKVQLADEEIVLDDDKAAKKKDKKKKKRAAEEDEDAAAAGEAQCGAGSQLKQSRLAGCVLQLACWHTWYAAVDARAFQLVGCCRAG